MEENPKKSNKIFLSEKIALVAAIGLGLGILYLLLRRIGIDEVIHNFEIFPLIGFVLVFVITALSVIVTCEKWRLILRAYGHNIRFSRLLFFKLAGWTVSYLTPSLFVGGEPVRAYMIKKEEKVPWSKALSSIVVDKALEGATGSFVVLLGVVLLFFGRLLSSGIKIFLLVLVVFFLYLLLHLFIKGKSRGFVTSVLHILHLDRLRMFKTWQKSIANFDQNLSVLFKDHKRVFFLGIALSCISCALALLRYKIIVYFLGLDISLYQIVIIYALTVLVVVIPFIPGAFGTYESVQAFSFALLGLGAQTGITCIFIMRIMDLILVGLGLVFLSYFGLMKLGKLYWIIWRVGNKNNKFSKHEEKK